MFKPLVTSIHTRNGSTAPTGTHVRCIRSIRTFLRQLQEPRQLVVQALHVFRADAQR